MNSREFVNSRGSRVPAPRLSVRNQRLTDGAPIALTSRKAMLKIQRSSSDGVVYSLSGRIEMEDLPELQRLFGLEEAGQQIVLDLQEVMLIGRDAVKFLARCEADHIRLENCPAYIRGWIDADIGRNGRHQS